VPTATGTDVTAGVSSPVQTAVQASLPTTTKSVSSALPVDASEGISAEAEPAVGEAASNAVASADHAAADQSNTTSNSGRGSPGGLCTLGTIAWSGLRTLLSDSRPLVEQLLCSGEPHLQHCAHLLTHMVLTKHEIRLKRSITAL